MHPRNFLSDCCTKARCYESFSIKSTQIHSGRSNDRKHLLIRRSCASLIHVSWIFSMTIIHWCIESWIRRVRGIFHQEMNTERQVLYYHSGSLSASSEKCYPTMKLETLTIFKCTNRIKHFLFLGRGIIIQTHTHTSVFPSYFKNSKNWISKQIIHVKGEHNCSPEFLSTNSIANKTNHRRKKHLLHLID